METEAVILPKWLVEDRVPKWVPKEFHGVYDKELALTNLKDDEIRFLDLQLLAAEIAYRLSIPYDVQGPELELYFTSLRTKLFSKLRRSRLGFERKLEATQRIEQEVKSIPKLVKKRWSIFGREVEKEEVEEAEE